MRLAAFVAVMTLATCSSSFAQYQLNLLPQCCGYITFSDLSAHPLGDFDGDGVLEFALVENVPNTGSIFHIVDATSFQNEFQTEILNIQYQTIRGAPVDLNNDRIPDVLLFRANGEVIGSLTYGGGPSALPPESVPLASTPVGIRPNPFNPSATIDYSLASKGNASLRVYDAAGRFVRTLVDGPVEPGSYAITWDGRDNAGHVLPSGTYFYSFSLDGQVLDKGKAVILK